MDKPFYLVAFLLLTSFSLSTCALSPDSRMKYYESGHASWYGKKFHGRTTANGEKYNMYAMTAAHKKLPFGTKVKVVHPETDESVVVRINDRGPFIKGRVIDLSYKAAKNLGIIQRGWAPVKIFVLDH